MSSSRDSWERLVAAVLKREQIWQLCHQNSISTISSEDSDEQILYLSSNRLASPSVYPSPRSPLKTPPVSQGAIVRMMFSAWYKRREPMDKYLDNIPEDLRIHLGRLRRFSLKELQVATENFRNITGYRFKKLYEGRLADGFKVAVKRLRDRGDKNAAEQFLEQVQIDSFASHPNILHLLGFCITRKEWLLVYPWIANGSVASQLRDRHESQPPLNWPTRKGIALGVAKGLAHLHEECDKKILHCDIKAASILLNEDFEAVVANMELGMIAEHNASDIVVDSVRGTIGHIAPEYLATHNCSDKNDVFGYGVFLLELITGHRAFDLARLANDEDVMLLDWAKRVYLERDWKILIGEDFGGDYMKEVVVEQLVLLALICSESTPQGRPMMSEVVRMLENVDGFRRRREEWHKNEAIIKNLDSTSITYDDTSQLASEELPEHR